MKKVKDRLLEQELGGMQAPWVMPEE